MRYNCSPYKVGELSGLKNKVIVKQRQLPIYPGLFRDLASFGNYSLLSKIIFYHNYRLVRLGIIGTRYDGIIINLAVVSVMSDWYPVIK